MPEVLVEVCCNSAGDVFRAKEGGAARVELNSALFMGGLTPSIGEMTVAKEAGLPIMAMVRPREGGFCYDEYDFKTMLADTEALLAAEADGIVFGILDADGRVDTGRCRQMLDLIGPKQSVFHRAIDVVPDWASAIDALAALGFTRILTSGQQNSVQAGADTVRQMREYAAGRIEINPGGGIRLNNVRDVIAATGCDQIHVSMRGTRSDPSIPTDSPVHFWGTVLPAERAYSATDPQKLQDLMAQL